MQQNQIRLCIWSGVFLILADHPAFAQSGGVLPGLTTDARIGDLRPQLERFFEPGQSLVARPAWILTPSIETDVGATDNVFRQSRSQKADVFVNLIPQIVVSGDTARLTATLNYSPVITEYASSSSQNQVSQFFNGQGLATLVRDTLYVDFRGSVTQQSLANGGFNQVQTQSYNRQNSVQTTSFSVMPYVEHRFGGYGAGRLSYSYSYTDQSTPDQTARTPTLLGNNSYGVAGTLSTQRETGTFTSGENFGRFTDTFTAKATQYSGVNAYAGAYRNEIYNELGFALTRELTLLTGLGYESIHYSGIPPTDINGLTYDIGLRYAPNPDTTLTVEYGKHEGENNLSADGQLAITPRLRLIARYSTGITTDLEQSQGLLGGSTLTSTGVLTDSHSGAPIGSTSTGFSGLQNGVYRLKRFSAELLFIRPRDSYAFSINNDQRTTLSTSQTYLGTAIIPAGTSTNSTYASLSWQHDLTPSMGTNLTAQYGITDSTSQFVAGTGQTQTTLSLSAALTKQFTETLSGGIRYVFIDQSGGSGSLPFNNGFNSGSYTSNTILLSLRKNF